MTMTLLHLLTVTLQQPVVFSCSLLYEQLAGTCVLLRPLLAVNTTTTELAELRREPK